MILCPNCEVPLSTADLLVGNCPVCHTVITPDMETIPASRTNRIDQPPLSSATYPTNEWAGAVTDDHATLPVANEPVNNEPTTPFTSRHRRWYGVIAIGTALVVILIGVLLLRQWHTPLVSGMTGQSTAPTAITSVGGTSTPATNGGATNGGATSGPAQSVGAPSVGTPTATTTPASATPAVTGTPTPLATAPPSDQPLLRVSPLTFSLLACVNSQETFTIANQGNATLRWSASTSYTLNQTPGPLAAGANIAVTVSGINKSGTVVITATDLAGKSLPTSPQTVTITCTV